MDKEQKESKTTESRFSERMQDFEGITAIKVEDAVNQDFIDRLTDSSGTEVIKKEPKNTRVE